MKAFVLGGGPAGLAFAQGITEGSTIPFTLLEERDSLGGLAQTLPWDKHGSHDLGPHKIFTLDAKLMARVRALLPEEDWLLRPKRSSIYLRGHYLPYPPSPFSLVNVFGPVTFAKMVSAYGVARALAPVRRGEPRSFKDDLERRVGAELYARLFEPLASKLWGDPALLDATLSKGRVQTPSLVEVVKKLLKLQKSSSFEALEFSYPRGGLGRLWSAIHERTKSRGKYLLRRRITGLDVKNRRIVGITHRDPKTGAESTERVGPEDFVFSTLPLGALPKMMPDALGPDTARRIAETIRLNDLVLVFLKIDKPSLIDESWVFVPDPSIVFHRVSEQESFDPQMTSNGSIVCCEIMSHEGRPLAGLPDEELVSRVQQSLSAMRLGGFKLVDSRVIRLKSSYPVYRIGYEEQLTKVFADLDAIENFRTIGRQGSFNYIGTLDAMDIGYGAAEWLAGRVRFRREDATTWSEERRRTSHYAVLD